jgi:hypothetical protein
MGRVLTLGVVVLGCAMGCAGRAGPVEEPGETLTWSVPGDGRPTGAPAPAAGSADDDPGAEVPGPQPDAPMEPLDHDRTTDLCRDPALARIRGALPEVPLCQHGVPARFVSVVHGGRQVVVVGYRDDRPTWVDGLARYGAAVLLDGTALPEDRPGRFWEHLGPLEQLRQPEVPNLLQAVLLEDGVFAQMATLEQAGEALAGWPTALDAVRAHPPGLHADATGHHMRVWSHRAVAGLGVQCRHLARHELTLTRRGRVVVHPRRQWATGTRQGEPCGAPLPER